MQVTHETRRVRWRVMLATWGICGLLILLHTRVVRDYVALLDVQGRHGAAPATPLQQVIPARYADAQMWVRHALAGREAGVARVRFTAADNAPAGREVHWASPFAWLVRAAGSLQRALTGQPFPLAQERALLWFNAPLFFSLVVALSAWIASRAGAGAGVLVTLAMIGHPRFSEGFAPMYVDHHGLVVAAVFGLVGGAMFMGAGWVRPDGTKEPAALPVARGRAHRAAIFSALCGAFGLWLSAAVLLPVIALVGTGALAAVWWQGRALTRHGAQFDPGVWRRWGRTGAIASFAFYLIEYAPSHLALRLEVNHPLYSLAWWGGAEIVALLGAWLQARGRSPGAGASTEQFQTRPEGEFHLKLSQLLLPLLALLAAPFTILVGGSSVFLVSDPFVGAMRHFVAEGRSFVASARQYGLGPLWYHLASAFILVPAVILVFRWRDERRLPLAFATFVAGGLTVMAFFDLRWWLAASGPQILVVLAMLAPPAGSARPRWLMTTSVALVLFAVPASARIVRDHRANQARATTALDLLQPLYRDIAATLRASQPEGDIVVLATPNPSLGIAYYGAFKSLGTLFWENASGLRAAATVLCARTDDEAAALIKARAVTHVVEVSGAPFLREYFQLLHPRAPSDELKQTFGYRLATDWNATPRWLQPIPYRVPAELKAASAEVRLFRVAWEQKAHEHGFHVAIAQVAAGDVAGAEQTIAAAFAAAPAGERQALHASVGAAFYDLGADALAVRVFRQALALGHDPDLANTVAWILATSSNAALRDGPAALALVQPLLVRARSDPMVLSTFAAAAAEVGRFPEAVRAGEQALALVRAANDREAVELLQRRLESYRAGRPWRQ